MIKKSIKERIRDYFFINSTARLRVRQIEREVAVPLPSAIRYTKELVKEGILQKTAVAGVVLYSADRTSPPFKHRKRLFNILRLEECGLLDYLRQEYHNPTIILFGSFSRAEDTEESDIDIYIETPEDIRGLERFHKKLGHDIQIFKYKNIRTVENKELANSILNGIVVNGFVEVF